MKKQKTNKFIEKDFEYDFFLIRDLDMDISKEKIPRKRMRNNVRRKKVNKKIDLKYFFVI